MTSEYPTLQQAAERIAAQPGIAHVTLEAIHWWDAEAGTETGYRWQVSSDVARSGGERIIDGISFTLASDRVIGAYVTDDRPYWFVKAVRTALGETL